MAAKLRGPAPPSVHRGLNRESARQRSGGSDGVFRAVLPVPPAPEVPPHGSELAESLECISLKNCSRGRRKPPRGGRNGRPEMGGRPTSPVRGARCSIHPDWDPADYVCVDELVALEDPLWLRAKERIALCRDPFSTNWIGGRDREGELDPWMHPMACLHRFHDDCRALDVVDSIQRLDAERKVAKERALGVLLFTYRRCDSEVCKWIAWCRISEDVARWRSNMRYSVDGVRMQAGRENSEVIRTESMRFVLCLEEHLSGWPHAHMVARFLPATTRWIQVHRKGKKVWREVASKHVMRRAKRVWTAISGTWGCFWEVVATRAEYIADYINKLSLLPDATKAILTVNRKRIAMKSNELLNPDETPSRWIVTRGRPSKVMEAVGLSWRPDPSQLLDKATWGGQDTGQLWRVSSGSRR